MRRSIGAGLTLVALLAALIPGGLSPLFLSGSRSCCCLAHQCPMAGGQMRMPGECHHGMGGNASPASSACSCCVSQAPGSAIPSTAFRFSFDLTAIVPLLLPHIDVHRRAGTVAIALEGYALFLDQPPRP